MKKPAAVAAVAALCASLFAPTGCAGDSGVSYDFSGVSYGFVRGSLEARDKALTVKLEGNPTTGYEWSAEVGGTTLKQVASDYQSDESDEPTCGQGGTYTFAYEGIGQGTATVEFTYARPWEPDGDKDVLQLSVETDDQGNILSTAVMAVVFDSSDSSDSLDSPGLSATSGSSDSSAVPGSSGVKLLNASKGSVVASADGFDCVEYSVFGTSATGDKYVLRRTDAGVLCSHYLVYLGAKDSEELVAQSEGDAAEYMNLVAAFKEAGVRDWDGYSGSNPNVLDGTSFSLRVEFCDGQEVTASGTNASPSGFGDFRDALMGAFGA